MITFTTIEASLKGKVGFIALNRPEVHNAMNATMISEIKMAIIHFANQKESRAIVFRGNGKSFCSGADLNYMKEQAVMTMEQNIEDSLQLASLFMNIYSCPLPVIAVVHGTVAGGANGIIAASDYAISAQNAIFRFSEVQLGLVPATIAPFVIDRIGRSASMELMLTGRSFSGVEAEKYGLVNASIDFTEIENELDKIINLLLKGGPQAIRNTKKLLTKLNEGRMQGYNLQELTASVIAEARASSEGHEGISSFFEKRKPNWINESIQ